MLKYLTLIVSIHWTKLKNILQIFVKIFISVQSWRDLAFMFILKRQFQWFTMFSLMRWENPLWSDRVNYLKKVYRTRKQLSVNTQTRVNHFYPNIGKAKTQYIHSSFIHTQILLRSLWQRLFCAKARLK